MVSPRSDVLADAPAGGLAANDGRRQRGERNREAVIDAILDLLAEGYERPTTNEIAERSGVSVRSVFRHFDDVESLYSEAVERHTSRMLPKWLLETVPGPFVDRLDVFAGQRADLYEAMGTVRRVAERLRRTSPSIDKRLELGRVQLAAQIELHFAPELAVLAEEDRRTVLDALEMATSWYAWVALREVQGCSIERATNALTRVTRSLLGI